MFNSEYNEASKKINKEFAEVADLYILGNLAVAYHERNQNWPKKVEDISFSIDSLKLIFENFDTIMLDSKADSLYIWYKFSEKRKITIPIEFVQQDFPEKLTSDISWKFMDNAKYVNNIYDGYLQVLFGDKQYEIIKYPSINEHSR